MKNLLLTTCFVALFVFSSDAQVKFGIKAGVSPSFSPNTSFIYANRATPRTEFAFNVAQVSNALSLGMFAEADLNENFFLRIEGLYSQSETSYKVINTWNSGERSQAATFYNEKTSRINLPVSVGVHLGNVDITSGILTRFVINNDNEMKSMIGYSENLNKVQLGFQTGIDLNISNLVLGLAYQRDFQNYGTHMNVNGTNLGLLNNPSRLVASIGFRF